MAFRCEICGRTFRTKRGLQTHMARVHGITKNARVRIAEVKISRGRSKKGKAILVLRGNLDSDPGIEEIRIYLSKKRKRKKKGGETAPARYFG